MKDLQDLIKTLEKPPNICVVRLTTSYWKDKRGLHIKKSLTFLKRHSEGYQILKEDASAIGVEQVLNHITNLHDCEDGIYVVLTCNESHDFESGVIDSYDYCLRKI